MTKTLNNPIHFTIKWTCTTNYKQMGTLYFFINGSSGLANMLLSMITRIGIIKFLKSSFCTPNAQITLYSVVVNFFTSILIFLLLLSNLTIKIKVALTIACNLYLSFLSLLWNILNILFLNNSNGFVFGYFLFAIVSTFEYC